MTNFDPFKSYLEDLQDKLSTGDATERTHYSTLEAVLKTVEEEVVVINEPKRIECGAPDFIVNRRQTPIGYLEAKDVGANLDAAERSEQMGRYFESLNNLILTNYLEFRWFVEGEHRETVKLGTLTRDSEVRKSTEGVRDVADLLHKFYGQQVPTIGRSEELAERMASLAGMIRRLIEETFEQESGTGALHAQMKAFRETLIPDLDPSQFADMYAQTITYGLFAARVHVESGKDFTRQDAWTNLPQTNPFLRRLFNEIAGPDLDERIAWLVDDLAHLLARADMAEVLHDFGRRTRQEDPVVHFYETFLRAYDPQMRQTRGVYYTPEPVVSYIVCSIDRLLETYFDRSEGLAEKDVLILDPAVGTATFLYFAIRQIHETLTRIGVSGVWNDYVENHLLPRLFGFELLMAPYTVAHMKLGILLQETGYEFAGDQRLGIYLTNSLEKSIQKPTEGQLVFAGFIEEEAQEAAHIKQDKPIMVVLGNPPYSVSSANKGKYIEDLMDRYKEAVRDEQNIQPLSDDYIKFIRFAHDRIERTGHGVIGMITNHTYLSGLIHRGMREELLGSFDEIYVLNLHGNSLVGETAPDGGPDENVFDIRQGVATSLFVKKREGKGLAEVKYADLWGRREGKYRYLIEQDVSTTAWQRLEPEPPYYFFVPKEFDFKGEYGRGWSVADIFPVNSSGVKTHRDHFVIGFEKEKLRTRIAAFRDETSSNDEIRRRFGLRDSGSWKLSEARKNLRAQEEWEESFHHYLHRPFDSRTIYYSDIMINRSRRAVMKHMLSENMCLMTMRQVVGDPFRHVLVSDILNDMNVLTNHHVSQVSFPLYLYPNDGTETLFDDTAISPWEPDPDHGNRVPNLSKAFVEEFAEKLGLAFDAHKVNDSVSDGTFGPRDVLAYAYAIFHSPTYRERYAEFLKIDFPRLPLTSDRALFAALAEKGEKLVALHLMESPKLNQSPVRFPVSDSNQVISRHPRHLAPGEPEPESGEPLEEGRVHINETQYFEGIDPDVWAFEIGGYQVLEKWLRDRKRADYPLSFDDVRHYGKIVVALKETIQLMEAIDETIPKWPIE